MSKPTLNFWAYLDVIRLTACFMVLLYHFYPEAFPYGYYGVDLFFMLSGFFIAKIVVENPYESFTHILVKRIVRLAQPLLPVFFLSFTIYLILFDGYIIYYGSRTALATILGLSNVELFFQGGYFSDLNNNKLFLHFWSLGVEFQFYIVSIFLLKAATSHRHTIVYIYVFFVFSQILGVLSFQISEKLSFFSPVGRFYEFAIGMLLYLIIFSKLSSTKRVVISVFISIALIVLGFWSLQNYWLTRQLVYVPFVGLVFFGLTLIISYISTRTGVYYKKLRNFAKSTYSIYLIHWPIMIAVGKLTSTNTIGLVISILMGYAIENRSGKFGDLSKTFIACLSISLGTFFYGNQTKTFDPIFAAKQLVERSVKYEEKLSTNSILIVGDSFGQDLLMLADHLLEMDEKRSIHYIKVLSNCGPVNVKYLSYEDNRFSVQRCSQSQKLLESFDSEAYEKIIYSFNWHPETVAAFKMFLNEKPLSPIVKNLVVLSDKQFCDIRTSNCDVPNVWSIESIAKHNAQLSKLSKQFGFQFIDWATYLPDNYAICTFSFDGFHLADCLASLEKTEALIELVF